MDEVELSSDTAFAERGKKEKVVDKAEKLLA
jgi:hypothetical protein